MSQNKLAQKSQALFYSLLYFLLATLAMLICYFYVDKPVAFWMHAHISSTWKPILKYFTYQVRIINFFVFLFFIYYVWRVIKNRVRKTDKVFFAVALAVVISSFFKNSLKIIFGRYWPLTWYHGNLSLISNNTYGFNFFHGYNDSFAAFPSGHTTIIVAAMTVLALAWPRLKYVFWLPVALVMIGLIALDYHFVSDAIGGMILGYLIGFWTYELMFKIHDQF